MPYHNAVFIGYDEKGIPRYAALRGTASKFKGEATGSDKQYSFNIPAAKESTTVHLFEAAIDLLSYATMEYRAGRDWHKDHLLSLAGVFITKPSVSATSLRMNSNLSFESLPFQEPSLYLDIADDAIFDGHAELFT